MELDYTYFEADEGGYVGYFTDFPQHVTGGETIEELEEMLTDMFDCLRRVHTPPLWGEIKGMYPETNSLPKQPYPARSAAGLVDCLNLAKYRKRKLAIA